jgi:hypothetical protein
MNATEQMFAIPTHSDSYSFGWGYCPEGADGGNWMYVKGIDYEGQPFQHWAFMRHQDIKLFDSNPTRFFKDYSGITEVVEIKRDLAWRQQKSQYRWGA